MLFMIRDLNTKGQGLGVAGGQPLCFIPGALPGEVVRAEIIRAKKNYTVGQLREIVSSSPERIKPHCPKFPACGGCQLMHISYEAELRWKENHVREQLRRIGALGDVIVEPIIGAEATFYYRNKVMMPVDRKNGKMRLGMFGAGSHDIVDADHCYVQPHAFDIIRSFVRKKLELGNLEPYHEKTHTGLVRQLLLRCGFNTKEVSLTIIVNLKAEDNADELCETVHKWYAPLRKRLLDETGYKLTGITLNHNTRRGNTLTGPTLTAVAGNPDITEIINGISYKVSPLSFFQVNTAQTEKLYKQITTMATGHPETILDLYCGTGSIGLQFLKAKHIIGIDVVASSIENARQNAARNGITNATYVVAKAEDWLAQTMARRSMSSFENNLRHTVGTNGTEELIPSPQSGNPDTATAPASSGPSTAQHPAKRLASERLTELAGTSAPQFLPQPELLPEQIDLAIIDPPRKGIDAKLTKALIEADNIKELIYVSCNPATLARDLAELQKAYTINKIQPLDLFPRTTHVECVTSMARK